MKILLIEDEKLIRITLSDTLRKHGFEVEACDNGRKGMQLVEQPDFDVVVTDLRLPGAQGLEILKHSKSTFPDREIIIMTAYASVETAVEALRQGAYDYLVKPFSPEELIHTLNHIRTLKTVIRENTLLRQRVSRLENREIIGTSPAIKRLTDTLRIVGPQDFSVLITGESGTGKELAARQIHTASDRAAESFIAVNCAVIPETLMESELFGYEKGAFSGATRQHTGYFERANKGTLFIDDIDDIPLGIQVKLLRALQEREIERLGGKGSIPIDIRVVCATKKDLGKLADEGAFRKDLYFRLNVVPVEMPPLRDRMEDIPHLLNHFLRKYDADDNTCKRANHFLPQLLAYDWPGNVRELENIVQRIIALPFLDDLALGGAPEVSTTNLTLKDQLEISGEDIDLDYERYIREKNREIICLALKQSGNKVSTAARLLGLPRSTLRSKLERYCDGEIPLVDDE